VDIARDLFYAQHALAALFSAANKLQTRGDVYLGDLTIRQMLAIPAILHAPGGKVTISHIARTLGTTKQSAKQIVEAMEKKKYISTAPSGQDRRAVDVAVTPEGEQAFRACSQRTDVFLADIFRDFTTEDLEAFWRLLEKLNRFDSAEAGDSPETAYRAADGAEILRHHQNFLKRRTNSLEAKDDI
jgi:DNA-binding MarR family transcriptional regulator